MMFKQIHGNSSASDTPGVIAPPPIFFAVGFGAAMLLNYVHSLLIPILPAGTQWPGITLMNASAAIALWATYAMRKARTSINPLRPATSLVTSGPYRFSRNPLSVALIVLYLGLALRINTLWPMLLLLPLLIAFHYGVIQREERYLERKFGDTYRNYRSTVPRWL
jgi:protein-S-isoprenylcysteine O-methyltransferase Ste14